MAIPIGNGKSLISGLSLAHKRLSKVERALLAAELVTGKRQLKPTAAQAAQLVKVSPTYVSHALKIIDDPKLLVRVDWGGLALADAAKSASSLARLVLPAPVASAEAAWLQILPTSI